MSHASKDEAAELSDEVATPPEEETIEETTLRLLRAAIDMLDRVLGTVPPTD